MLFSKQDYEYLYNSLSKKFSLYTFIDSSYLNNLLDSLCNDGIFEDLKITEEKISRDANPLFYLSFKIQNYLYCKICKLAEEDIDMLLTLVEDKRRIVTLVFRKLKVEDDSKLDDYIMNVASLYNGEEAFDTFLTRYIMSSLKGVSFEIERKTKDEDKVPVVIEDTSKKKKKNKKKDKNKKNRGSVLVAEKTKKKDDSDSIIVDGSFENKDVIQEGDVSCGCIDTVVISEETDEFDIMENQYNTSVIDVVDSHLTDDRLEKPRYFDTVIEKCNLQKGTAIRDSFVGMVLMCDLVNKINFIDDERYKVYFLMRYGLMNDSFYSREEIANLCELSLEEVISYEKKTVEYLRKYLNQVVNNYENYLLCKSIKKA